MTRSSRHGSLCAQLAALLALMCLVGLSSACSYLDQDVELSDEEFWAGVDGEEVIDLDEMHISGRYSRSYGCSGGHGSMSYTEYRLRRNIIPSSSAHMIMGHAEATGGAAGHRLPGALSGSDGVSAREEEDESERAVVNPIGRNHVLVGELAAARW